MTELDFYRKALRLEKAAHALTAARVSEVAGHLKNVLAVAAVGWGLALALAAVVATRP